MSAQVMMDYFYLGLDSQGIGFVASKFVVVSFLCTCPRCCFKEIIPSLEVKISNNSSFLISLRAHSLQFTFLERQPLLN